MAAQSGSTYISGTVIDSVEIPTANLGFSTVTSSKKVPSCCTECETARQMMGMCAATWTQDGEQVQESWKLCIDGRRLASPSSKIGPSETPSDDFPS